MEVRKWKSGLAAGVAVGGMSVGLLADDLANLPIFQQPVTLSRNIEPIVEADPAPGGEQRGLFPRLRQRIPQFPQARGRSPLSIQPVAQLEPSPAPILAPTFDPGHSLGPDIPYMPDPIPPAPSTDEHLVVPAPGMPGGAAPGGLLPIAPGAMLPPLGAQGVADSCFDTGVRCDDATPRRGQRISFWKRLGWR